MRLLILVLVCGITWTVQAQRSDLKKLIRQDIKELSRIYQLDDQQEKAAFAVQERYYLQLEEITPLKAQNEYRAYLHKLKAVRQGREFGIKKLLRPDQWPTFEAEQARQQQAYLDKIAALKAGGAPKEKLELAKITIE